MEEPQQQTLAFINGMQSQLEELTGIQHKTPPSPTISSGNFKLPHVLNTPGNNCFSKTNF